MGYYFLSNDAIKLSLVHSSVGLLNQTGHPRPLQIIIFLFQFVIAAVLAVANAGIIASHGYSAPLAVAHAPVAIAHGHATSYQNHNSLSVHPVAVTHAVHAAPAVAVHAAPAIVAAPAIAVGHGYGHGYGHGLHY